MSQQRDAQTYAFIGTDMEVHNPLGHGFLEGVCQEALARELSLRNIPFERAVERTISYKGKPFSSKYRTDFICFGDVIVECKALCAISGVEEAQVINYLKASGKQRSLLINFGAPSLQYKRLGWNYPDLNRNHLRKSA